MKSNGKIARWVIFAVTAISLTAASYGQIAVGISVRIGPPALPVYAQPICPGPGYVWTPGYWGWNDDGGYYWVPGTWVLAPVGMLWTPGYWGWAGGVYAWHAGYWGPHVGFYGGVNYGFGYGGVGFAGGEWRGGAFYYNRSVTNVSVTNVTNVYSRTVVVNENHVAYNGGEGGIATRPTPQEEAYDHEPHSAPLAAQTEHAQLASQNRANFASENHGRPSIAATARPGDFSGHSVIAARSAGGEYHAPAMSPREARTSAPMNEGNRGEESRPFTPPNAGNSENRGSSYQERNNAGQERNNGENSMSQEKRNSPRENQPKHNNSQNSKPHKSSPPKNNKGREDRFR
ncbi:MAG TPA: hypothetical protein VMG31_03755 [Verrucomicrobiae bacterium]|nr:hypothetical protein [Verrucomicrobiae bacterium]